MLGQAFQTADLYVILLWDIFNSYNWILSKLL